MLFVETLDLVRPEIADAIDELFNTAYKNQNHPQDLLLVLENGSFSEIFVNHPTINASPCTLGPHNEGLISQSEYKFYDSYRRTVKKKEWLEKQLIENKDFIIDLYEVSAHLELMVYLKFWESDLLLKEYYELKELALSKEYNWKFSHDDYGKSRNVLIREHIRDPLKNICPKFYYTIKKTYKSQIRNAIAHSQYSTHPVNAFEPLNFKIRLHNYNPNPKKFSEIKSISFEEWAIYIHSVIMLYNEQIRCKKKYHNIYVEKAKANNLTLPILDCENNIREIYYDEIYDRWRPSRPN